MLLMLFMTKPDPNNMKEAMQSSKSLVTVLQIEFTLTPFQMKGVTTKACLDTVWIAINMMKPHCFMPSIALKDAYYSVPLCQDHQKFLNYSWKGKYYTFTAFPTGLALCPQKVTKLLKPVYAYLRSLGHLSVAYIDDSYLQGDTNEESPKYNRHHTII